MLLSHPPQMDSTAETLSKATLRAEIRARCVRWEHTLLVCDIRLDLLEGLVWSSRGVPLHADADEMHDSAYSCSTPLHFDLFVCLVDVLLGSLNIEAMHRQAARSRYCCVKPKASFGVNQSFVTIGGYLE